MLHVMSGLLGFLLRSRCFCCPEVEKLQMTYPSSRPSEGSTLKINRTGEDGWTLSFLGPKGGRSLNRWVVNFRRVVVQQYSSQLWTVSQNLGLSLYDQINCVLKKEKIRFSSWFFYTLTISCQKIKKNIFLFRFSAKETRNLSPGSVTRPFGGQKISCENTSATDFQLLAPEIIQQKKSDGPSFSDLHLGYEILHTSTKYICYTLI